MSSSAIQQDASTAIVVVKKLKLLALTKADHEQHLKEAHATKNKFTEVGFDVNTTASSAKERRSHRTGTHPETLSSSPSSAKEKNPWLIELEEKERRAEVLQKRQARIEQKISGREIIEKMDLDEVKKKLWEAVEKNLVEKSTSSMDKNKTKNAQYQIQPTEEESVDFLAKEVWRREGEGKKIRYIDGWPINAFMKTPVIPVVRSTRTPEDRETEPCLQCHVDGLRCSYRDQLCSPVKGTHYDECRRCVRKGVYCMASIGKGAYNVNAGRFVEMGLDATMAFEKDMMELLELKKAKDDGVRFDVGGMGEMVVVEEKCWVLPEPKRRA